MSKRYRLSRVPHALAMVMLISCLSACQSLQTHHRDVSSQQQYQKISRIHAWQAKGKIGLRFKEDRQSASFTWAQKSKHFDIHLFGPFGQGSTWLKKRGRRISLQTPDYKYHAETAEALMESVLGWQVPISNLQYWMLGIPAAGPSTLLTRDEHGFITGFVQDGWQVNYSKQERFNGLLLPTKMTVTGIEMKLTVIVKEWIL